MGHKKWHADFITMAHGLNVVVVCNEMFSMQMDVMLICQESFIHVVCLHVHSSFISCLISIQFLGTNIFLGLLIQRSALLVIDSSGGLSKP